jgi:hypothetical protein
MSKLNTTWMRTNIFITDIAMHTEGTLTMSTTTNLTVMNEASRITSIITTVVILILMATIITMLIMTITIIIENYDLRKIF